MNNFLIKEYDTKDIIPISLKKTEKVDPHLEIIDMKDVSKLDSFVKIKKLVDKDNIIFGTYGIHPHEAKNDKITSELIVKIMSSFKYFLAFLSAPAVSNIFGSYKILMFNKPKFVFI